MSKFLNLLEEFDPTNNENPKWTLIDFLKSKGINVSLVRDTDMLYIDTGSETITVTVTLNEEEQEIQVDSGDPYMVDKEVEKLGSTASSGLKGTAGKLFGTSAQQAKAAIQQRAGVAKQAVGVYKKSTDKLKQGLRDLSRPPQS